MRKKAVYNKISPLQVLRLTIAFKSSPSFWQMVDIAEVHARLHYKTNLFSPFLGRDRLKIATVVTVRLSAIAVCGWVGVKLKNEDNVYSVQSKRPTVCVKERLLMPLLHCDCLAEVSQKQRKTKNDVVTEQRKSHSLLVMLAKKIYLCNFVMTADVFAEVAFPALPP